ncbi:MAG: hypothetical protein E7558_08735 [Ruminococcaceae bacterium]|nr:hypothetical protein [Oscillospiraceae bacterium]
MLKVINQGHRKSIYNQTVVGTEYGNEPGELWYKTYNVSDPDFHHIYQDGIDLMRNRAEALSRIASTLIAQLDIIANFPIVKHISGAPYQHENDLLNIIKARYPYGIETDTTNEYAAKMLKAKKIVSSVFLDESSKEIQLLNFNFSDQEQLCMWDNATYGAVQCVDWLIQNITDKFLKKGCIQLSILWCDFCKPPFGAYKSNWYEYLFATAVKQCTNEKMFIGDSMHSAPLSYDALKDMVYGKYGWIFIQNERQTEFGLLLAKLFDVPFRETVQNTITSIRSKVSENIKIAPLDWIDHRLYEILCGSLSEESWDTHQVKWFTYGYENKYLPWLKENFHDLYVKIQHIDQDFTNEIISLYGEHKANLYIKSHTIKGGAVGWLHSAEMVRERIDMYMNKTMCNECGAVIGYGEGGTQIAYEHMTYDHITHQTQYYDFSQKDIIGLNKKLICRNNTDYLCIPCLCEYTEATPVELWELMHDFKEQGCDLFA